MSVDYDQPTILMCPPDHYGIEYEINPWMQRSKQSDRELAIQQWQNLCTLIESAGAVIRLMPAVPGLPDLVFTANAGLIYQQTVLLSRFRHADRRGETLVDETWFQAEGFQTLHLPEHYYFEGAGDALFCNDTLFAGYIIRSDAGSMQWTGNYIGCRVLPLQLVNPAFYHLDTCFCPVDTETAIYYPLAFDGYGQKVLQGQIPNLIEVTQTEAAQFACNAVVIGKHVIMNKGCPTLEQNLKDRGFETSSTDLSEFLKSGGSAKCLTLRLDGEDAARWPQ